MTAPEADRQNVIAAIQAAAMIEHYDVAIDIATAAGVHDVCVGCGWVCIPGAATVFILSVGSMTPVTACGSCDVKIEQWLNKRRVRWSPKVRIQRVQ